MSLRTSLKNMTRRDPATGLRKRAADLQADLSRVARPPAAEPVSFGPAVSEAPPAAEPDPALAVVTVFRASWNALGEALDAEAPDELVADLENAQGAAYERLRAVRPTTPEGYRALAECWAMVLIGDRRQLASVAGASALRAVAEVVGRSAVLGEVRRQTVDWQRAASVVMARGDAEAGLRAYAAEHQVELVSGIEAARGRVITAWTEQRARHGGDVLIVTRRNADAAALNARARAVLRVEGQLGPDLITPPARDREDRIVPLALAVGDHLRFGESLSHLKLRNGSRARVEAIVAEPDGGARLRLALEDDRVIEVAWDELRRVPRFGRRPVHPKVVHAYAGTTYAAQGRTCSAAVMYLGSGTDAREIYVGLTRHRHEARVVAERDRLDALCRQRQADPRMPATNTMILERLFREARSYHEKANVVDYAADRVAFVRDGLLRLPEHVATGIDVGRAVRAARALREAAAWLGVERLIVPAWRLVDAYGRRLSRGPAPAVRSLVAQLARRLGRPDPEHGRGRGHGIER